MLPWFTAEPAARELARSPGFCMLDSLDPVSGEPQTLLAANPIARIRGSLQNPAPLQEAIALMEHLPTEVIWAGGFQYDGQFDFLCYPTPMVIGKELPEEWREADPPPIPKAVLRGLEPEWSREEYARRVRRIQDYIVAGDIYQVNLCQRFHGAFEGSPLALHLAVRRIAQARFAAFLPLFDRQIVCGSPELFLRMHGREIETRPIKGTRPRGANPEEDARLREELIHSTKEQAELLMITDLERNDLGQVCEYGSVQVDALAQVDAHPQLFHLSSVIRGKLRPEIDHLSALAACFPGGSITGAPKSRAIRIIEEMEGFDRRSFCGAFGFFSQEGAVFNIGIRLAEIEGHRFTAYAGSGIVADSNPEAEYEETLLKARHWEGAARLLAQEFEA